MIIAIDFDGTIVDHRFPDIGAEVPGAIAALREFQEAGARLILWTMRSDMVAPNKRSPEGHSADRNYLTEAVEFCRARGVTFWGVNANPEQADWTGSPKQYAHLYIDDAAFGCPLRDHPRMGSRPCVDWERVRPAVLDMLRSSPHDAHPPSAGPKPGESEQTRRLSDINVWMSSHTRPNLEELSRRIDAIEAARGGGA